MIISEFEFEYNPQLGDPKAIYPSFQNSNFVMELQIGAEFYRAVVLYDNFAKDIALEIFDPNGERIQPRLKIVEDVNMLYLFGYYLVWNPKLNRFVFGKGDGDDAFQIL